MDEHKLKRKGNRRLLDLQTSCRAARIEDWELKLESTITTKNGPIDMYVVREPTRPGMIMSVGMGHGDIVTRDFLIRLFKGIVPALAGSILCLEMWEAAKKLREEAADLDTLLKLEELIEVIDNSVATYDEG